MTAAVMDRPTRTLLPGRLPDIQFDTGAPPVQLRPTFPDDPPLVIREATRPADDNGRWRR